MATVDDLEAALLTAWTPENLQVYGDHLQGIGDPRGELISVDLHAEEHGASRDVAHRRRRAIRAWLELPVNAELRGIWGRTRFAFGFVEDLAADEVDRVLASPTARYIRSVDLRGKFSAIKVALDRLATHHLPWLRRISIRPRYQSEGRPWTDEPPLLGDFTRFVTAAPNLEILDVRGHRLIGDFPHPKLRELRVRGYDAIRALFDPSANLPAVTRLVLGLGMFDELPMTRAPRVMPSLVGLPALRELDLAPNEATATRDSIGHGVAFEVLRDCAPIAQLERVRIPKLRDTQDHARMQQALDKMSALRELRVMRAIAPGMALQHPTAAIEVDQVPWPPLTSSKASGYIDLWLPNVKEHFSLWLPTEVHTMRSSFDDLGPRARASWSRIWEALEQIADRESTQLDVQTLLDAVDTMKIENVPHLSWFPIRELLRHAVSTDKVTIERRLR